MDTGPCGLAPTELGEGGCSASPREWVPLPRGVQLAWQAQDPVPHSQPDPPGLHCPQALICPQDIPQGSMEGQDSLLLPGDPSASLGTVGVCPGACEQAWRSRCARVCLSVRVHGSQPSARSCLTDDLVLSKEQGPPVREIRRPARLTTTGRGGRSRERAPPAPFSPTWKPPVAADPAQCVGSISLGVSPHPSWRVALGTHGQAPHAGLCCLSPQGLSLLPRPVAKSVEMSSTGSFGLKDPVPRPPHPTLRPGSFSPGVQPQVQEGAYCPLGDTPGLGARWPWARSSLSLEQEPVWGSVLPAVSGAEMCTHPTTTRGRSPEALWGGGQQVAAGRWWLLCLPTWPLLLPRFPSLHLPRLLALPHPKPIYVARRQINCDYVKLCNSVGCNLNRNKQGFSTFNALKTSIH